METGKLLSPEVFGTLRWTVDDGIGMLMLNTPPSNAMTLEFFHDFRRWTACCQATSGLRAVIIHGCGRHFSSGADLDELLSGLDEQQMSDNYESFTFLGSLPVPVIAAIRGVCLGSAFELALSCHFRICSEDAVMGLPEATFNLMPGIGGIGKTAALAGTGKALEMILHGTTFGANDALEMNLVDAVIPKREVLNEAIRFARTIPAGFDANARHACALKYLKKGRIHA